MRKWLRGGCLPRCSASVAQGTLWGVGSSTCLWSHPALNLGNFTQKLVTNSLLRLSSKPKLSETLASSGRRLRKAIREQKGRWVMGVRKAPGPGWLSSSLNAPALKQVALV